MRQTLTLDNGSEFANFKELEEKTRLQIYFADPYAALAIGPLMKCSGRQHVVHLQFEFHLTASLCMSPLRLESKSKSRFNPRSLEYFRRIVQTGEELMITDHDKPVLKITSFDEGPEPPLRGLRGTVVRYDAPMEPVAENDWDCDDLARYPCLALMGYGIVEGLTSGG